jgi:hypothetical protein
MDLREIGLGVLIGFIWPKIGIRDFCEHGIEHSGSINAKEFLD